MVSTKPKAPIGRPKTPRDEADQQAIDRIATLAKQVLTTLRQPGRGSRYDSERQLRKWLTDDGIQHSTSDIGPALTLLESAGLLVRPEVSKNMPRPGRLAAETPDDATAAAVEPELL